MSDHKNWTAGLIDDVKRRVRDTLDHLCESENMSRLKAIENRLRRLPLDDGTSDLERYVLLMSGLVHHIRYGGLSESQVRKSSKLIESIFLVNEIGPGRKQVASLYSEYKWVASQLRKKEGMHFASAWELGLAVTGSQNFPGGDSFANLMTGHRLLRVGRAGAAAEHYEKILSTGSEAFFERAVLGLVMAMRLGRQHELLGHRLREFRQHDGLSEPALLELRWHEMCLEYESTGNIKPLLGATRRGRSHYSAPYIMEASLWSRLTINREYSDKVVRMRSLKKQTTLKIGSQQQHLVPFISVFEDCYDVEIPLHLRKEGLHRQLSQMHRVQFADKVLLIWAAAVAFLYRCKATDLAQLALHEYVSFSYRCSDFQDCDALGFLRHQLPEIYEQYAEKNLRGISHAS